MNFYRKHKPGVNIKHVGTPDNIQRVQLVIAYEEFTSSCHLKSFS